MRAQEQEHRAREHVLCVHRERPSRGGGRPLAESWSEVRWAARRLERALPLLGRLLLQVERSDAEITGLGVVDSGRWFRPPGGAWTSLEGSERLARLLFTLQTQHREDAQVPLGHKQLIEALWPGERFVEDSGLKRLYALCARLRKLGLKGLLTSGPAGYSLLPTLRIVSAEPADLDP